MTEQDDEEVGFTILRSYSDPEPRLEFEKSSTFTTVTSSSGNESITVVRTSISRKAQLRWTDAEDTEVVRPVSRFRPVSAPVYRGAGSTRVHPAPAGVSFLDPRPKGAVASFYSPQLQEPISSQTSLQSGNKQERKELRSLKPLDHQDTQTLHSSEGSTSLRALKPLAQKDELRVNNLPAYHKPPVLQLGQVGSHTSTEPNAERLDAQDLHNDPTAEILKVHTPAASELPFNHSLEDSSVSQDSNIESFYTGGAPEPSLPNVVPSDSSDPISNTPQPLMQIAEEGRDAAVDGREDGHASGGQTVLEPPDSDMSHLVESPGTRQERELKDLVSTLGPKLNPRDAEEQAKAQHTESKPVADSATTTTTGTKRSFWSRLQVENEDSERSMLKQKKGVIKEASWADAIQAMRKAILDRRLKGLDVTDLTMGMVNFQSKEWKKNRIILIKKIVDHRLFASIFGLSGTCCAIAQNELILRGEEASSARMDILKALCSLFTIFCCLTIYRIYHLHELYWRVKQHLKGFHSIELNVHPNYILSVKSFWIEIIVLVFHVPPFITAEYGSWSQNNFVLHRAETIGACVSILRMYLVWRFFCDKYLMWVPKRLTIENYMKMEFGDAYVVKELLEGWQAFTSISFLWVFLLLVLGYWFRSVETTACGFAHVEHEGCQDSEAQLWTVDGVTFFQKENDLYLQNAIWAMFVSSTTVGYGDIIPTTHYGRIVTALMALFGIVLAAFLTAALSHSVMWTSDELRVMFLCQRAKRRLELPHEAAALVGKWWRIKKRPADQLQKVHDLSTARAKFREVLESQFQDMDQTKGDLEKVDSILGRTKYCVGALKDVNTRITEEHSFGSQKNFSSNSELAKGMRRSTSTLLPPPPPPPVNTPAHQKHVTPNQSPSARSPTRGVKPSFILREDLEDPSVARVNHMQGPSDKVVARRAALQEELRLRLGEVIKPKVWWRDHSMIEKMLLNTRLVLAPLAMGGTLCAIYQNESVMVEMDPLDYKMDVAKGTNTFVTLVCLALLCRVHWLSILHEKLMVHLHDLSPIPHDILFDAFYLVLGSVSFWVEAVVVAIHLPPSVTGTYGINMMQNFQLYRMETVFCVWNLSRIFLVWSAVKEWLVNDLPMKHTFAGFSGIRIGSSFAIKRAMNSWLSFLYISAAWFIGIMVLGYLFRCAEVTACLLENSKFDDARCEQENARIWQIYGSDFVKVNDMYLYNSFWFMFVSTTTIGFGDQIPTNHIGRVVAVVAIMLGVLTTALMTAALANLLQWTPKEARVRHIVHREHARKERMYLAVTILSRWWRRKRGVPLTRKQKLISTKRILRRWEHVKHRAESSLEDTRNLQDKIDLTQTNLIKIEIEVDKAARVLWKQEKLELMDMHSRWEEQAENDSMALYWRNQYKKLLKEMQNNPLKSVGPT